MQTLKHSFIRVHTEKGKSFGGNQEWLPYGFLKNAGCGVISATDTLLYLCSYHEACKKHRPVIDPDFLTQERYLQTTMQMRRYYLPVIPYFGMNGLTLAAGMNLFFRRKKIPFHASWGVPGERLCAALDEMLENDIPVILSIGPNFPKIWKKEKLTLYIKRNDGAYIAASSAIAHYVTVVSREGSWLKISSWGKEYYISLMEYRAYRKRYSSSLVSNLVYISCAERD